MNSEIDMTNPNIREFYKKASTFTMVNPNIKRFFRRSYLGKIYLDNKQENILLDIHIDPSTDESIEEDIIDTWEEWCFSNGYSKTTFAEESHPEESGEYIGKITLDQTYENVLTNIRVVEDQQGNSYSRDILQNWLQWCFNSYEKAYVVNIKSEAIKHILETLSGYTTSQVSLRKAPGNIESGIGVPDLTYEIVQK